MSFEQNLLLICFLNLISTNAINGNEMVLTYSNHTNYIIRVFKVGKNKYKGHKVYDVNGQSLVDASAVQDVVDLVQA